MALMASTNAAKAEQIKLLKFITCPHCWRRFQTCDIAWVARHEDLRGDPVLGQDAFLRFLPTRFNVNGEALDARGMACQVLACPRCHLTIARLFLRYEPLIFSLIGVPFSGKSYFLTAMTWELGRLLPSHYSLVFNDVDPNSNVTLADYQKSLFLQKDRQQHVGIIKTQLDSTAHYDQTNLEGQSVLLPRPFLYNMRPLREHPRADEAEKLTRILCLYDNAGEHFLPGYDTTLAPGTQHMAKAKVLMFLFDPVQDPRFREQCLSLSQDPQLNDLSHTQMQAVILTEAASRVRQYANLPASRRLDQPLLVLVAKSDIWSGLIDEDLAAEPFLPAGQGRFNLLDGARIRRVSQKVRALLARLAPEFVGAAEDACKEVVYFPVSALGCSPRKEGTMLVVRPQDIQPRWVTVPVLYAFARWTSGLVGIKG